MITLRFSAKIYPLILKRYKFFICSPDDDKSIYYLVNDCNQIEIRSSPVSLNFKMRINSNGSILIYNGSNFERYFLTDDGQMFYQGFIYHQLFEIKDYCYDKQVCSYIFSTNYNHFYTDDKYCFFLYDDSYKISEDDPKFCLSLIQREYYMCGKCYPLSDQLIELLKHERNYFFRIYKHNNEYIIFFEKENRSYLYNITRDCILLNLNSEYYTLGDVDFNNQIIVVYDVDNQAMIMTFNNYILDNSIYCSKLSLFSGCVCYLEEGTNMIKINDYQNPDIMLSNLLKTVYILEEEEENILMYQVFVIVYNHENLRLNNISKENIIHWYK
jgi:hypothetical protein